MDGRMECGHQLQLGCVNRGSGKMGLERYLGGAGMPGHCRSRGHF